MSKVKQQLATPEIPGNQIVAQEYIIGKEHHAGKPVEVCMHKHIC
jgi:hypothetical protein